MWIAVAIGGALCALVISVRWVRARRRAKEKPEPEEFDFEVMMPVPDHIAPPRIKHPPSSRPRRSGIITPAPAPTRAPRRRIEADDGGEILDVALSAGASLLLDSLFDSDDDKERSGSYSDPFDGGGGSFGGGGASGGWGDDD